MNAEFWIKIKGKKRYKSWDASTIQANKKKPTTASDEVAFKVNITIPDSVFEKPTFEANISIPETNAPKIDNVKIQKGIEDYLKKQTGLAVQVSYQEQ